MVDFIKGQQIYTTNHIVVCRNLEQTEKVAALINRHGERVAFALKSAVYCILHRSRGW
jgi:hypothetical protein